MISWFKLRQSVFDFEKEASNIVDKRKLVSLLLSLIDKICRVQSGSVFLLDKKKESFQMVAGLNIKEDETQPPESMQTIYYHATGNLNNLAYQHIPSFGFDEDLIELLIYTGALITKKELKNLSPATLKKLNTLKAYLCVPFIIKEHIIGFLIVGEKVSKKDYGMFEKTFVKNIADAAVENIEKILLYREVAQNLQDLELAYKQLQEYVHIIESEKESLEQAYLDITHTLIITLEARDSYTRGHSDRVVHYAKHIAKHLNLPPEEVKKIELAASLHDIGKIGTRDNILLKEASLTPEEQYEMKQHSEIGANILNSLGFLEPIVPLIRGHHEKWDGSGYPDGLENDQIPLGARIIAVSDAFDAMTSNRPYRKDMGINKAVSIIKSESGTQFDPDIVKVFVEIHNEITAFKK